jgi:putative hydrolase of HD superfamily
MQDRAEAAKEVVREDIMERLDVDPERFRRQVAFLLEVDKLKTVLRQTILTDCSRRENSAEHSWHIALSILVFSEYARERGLDLFRVMKILLVHDLVEIDAGDTYCYDAVGREDQSEREQKAAERIFGLLPPDQTGVFRQLWQEYEDKATPEAKFAHALDRFQPFLHNYVTQGKSWRQHGVRRHQVEGRMRPVEKGAPILWDYVAELIDDAVAKGYLAK